MRRACLWIGVLVLAAGCSAQPYQVAPVSGRVTLDGKPLAKAHVHFAPTGAEGKRFPGPTSQGATDADGRYTLTLDSDRQPGAVVGKHKVYIITVDTQAADDMPDAGGQPKRREILPERYNQETTLTFDVLPGGTTSADFTLTSK